MNYYFDTSALIKIYHLEPGSQKVIDIYNSEENIIISGLSTIELLSTIHRKYREKEINKNALEMVTDKFREDMSARYEVLKFTSVVLEESWRLIQLYAKEYALVTLDSLQFAFFTTYCEKEDIFVCSDHKLVKVVEMDGHLVLIP